ncbi:MAG TPA: hypothetical protein VMW49_00170 [Candidatus Dormibacteraeota bacterium]|nr:hypothetical protein [Candidatus Dormibacteraeota bacterium]
MSFLDGEMLYASAARFDMDGPVLDLEISSLGHHAERALIPLSAVRQIRVGGSLPPPPAERLATCPKLAIHFIDGEMLRAWAVSTAVLQRHGGIWDVVHPDGAERHSLAIPYSALKTVFSCRQWEPLTGSAGAGAAGDAARGREIERLATVHAERERHRLDGWAPPTPPRLLRRLRDGRPPHR